MNINDRGIILTDNVDIDWLKKLEPQFFPDYIKFVINPESNRVCVGMEVHRDCEVNMGNIDDLYGGNIFFENSEVIYESTLNISHNKSIRKFRGNPRIINDEETVQMLDAILKSWINL